jgi:carbonic anhydrase
MAIKPQTHRNFRPDLQARLRPGRFPAAPAGSLFGHGSLEVAAMPFRKQLLDNNRRWAQRMTAQDPEFFSKLSQQQTPKYLWIGCSDSRVPANEIIGLMPGEVFVHRNVANVVVHTDLNCLSVLQYAVEVLRVQHIIVCGHYGCGGVLAAMANDSLGLIDNWLRHIKDVYQRHAGELDAIADRTQRGRRLCELNIAEQAANICYTTIVQGAWQRGQDLSVHGFIYGLQDGILRDLGFRVASGDDIPTIYTVV